MAAENHHAMIDLAQKNQMTKSPNLNQNIIMAGEVIFLATVTTAAGFSVAPALGKVCVRNTHLKSLLHT